jgi:hypothetical protein
VDQEKRRVSPECVEQLHTWTMAHCPCALEDPETLPGYVTIVALEVERAVREACWKFHRNISKPCDQ